MKAWPFYFVARMREKTESWGRFYSSQLLQPSLENRTRTWFLKKSRKVIQTTMSTRVSIINTNVESLGPLFFHASLDSFNLMNLSVAQNGSETPP